MGIAQCPELFQSYFLWYIPDGDGWVLSLGEIMRNWLAFVLGLMVAGNVYAELPGPMQRPEISGVHADSVAISYSAQQALQAKLASSVFIVYARQPRPHSLATGDVVLDGAAVAIRPDMVAEI